MAGSTAASTDDLVAARWWPLLFPLTYLIHISEEYWGGEGFYNWVSRLHGIAFTAEQFLLLNAIGWTGMSIACAAAVVLSRWRPISTAFATVVLMNGVVHLLASAVTMTYSPGMLSGIALWIPLGALTLRSAFLAQTKWHFSIAVLAGFVLHGIVTALSALALTGE